MITKNKLSIYTFKNTRISLTTSCLFQTNSDFGFDTIIQNKAHVFFVRQNFIQDVSLLTNYYELFTCYDNVNCKNYHVHIPNKLFESKHEQS